MGQLNSRGTPSVTVLQEGITDELSLQDAIAHLQINGGTLSFSGRDTITVNNFHTLPGSEAAKDFEKMLDWFSLTNFRAMLIDNLEKRASGTGRKFIDGRLLQHWIKVKGSMLWGTGMPGAGKTVLASTVYDYLQTIAETAPPGAISVSFAYCRYTEAMSVRDILASLVRQFLERHPSLIPFAEPLYQRHSLERTKPTQADLVRLLVTMAKQFEMSYFGLDGLDEAKDDVQFNVLKIFSSLDVNFFITSRPLKMLESVLPQARHFNIAAHEDDIDLMFRERIDQNPACGHLFSRETFREEIIQAIKHKSSGMFLHAALQVEALQRCLNVADVRETVDSFPAKLEDMYQQTMDRISNQPKNHFDLAMRILTLLIHARSPLTIEDIQYALAICPETRSYHPERSVSQVHLVAVCCGLITLDKGSRSVRLIHYTARSMLEPAVLRHRPQPHADLTSACIGRLLASVYLTTGGPPKNEIRRPSFAFSEMEGFLLQGAYRRMAGRQPFLTYALDHWGHHARMCYSGLKDSIDDFIHRCHSLPSPFANARKVMPLGGPHLAAWHGFFHSFSRDQWVAHLHDRTLYYRWTPLMCALRNRQIDTSNMLSQLPDTDVNVQDWKGKTTLMHAVAVGHCGVISRLIANTNSDINRRDNEGRTALILAIEGEKVAPGSAMEAPNPTILKLVLSHPKIDVNSKFLVGNPLTYAIKLGNYAAAESLSSQPGIDMNATCYDGCTPLMYAVEAGEEAMVELFLGHPKTDVNATCDGGRTALMRASRHGHHRLVQLFLSHPSTKVDQTCHKGWTALDWAAVGARQKKRLLISHPEGSLLREEFRRRDYKRVKRLLLDHERKV